MGNAPWSNLHLKNWMKSIADDMIPIIKQRKEGQPRSISIRDVHINYEQDNEVHVFQTRVEFLSDVGEWEEIFNIRHFDSEYHFTIEKTQYSRLSARIGIFDNMNPLELIYSNEEERMLVYTTTEGVKLDDLGLPDHLYYFQLGKILGALHSGDTSKLASKKDDYNSMARYLIQSLPLKLEDQQVLTNGLDKLLKLFENSYAGYEPVAQFDLDHIRVIPLFDKITKSKILQDSAMKIEILPSLLNQHIMDRMEDIATIFAGSAYEEYRRERSLNGTIDDIISLMEGYEGYFEQYATAPMDRIYPNGLTLDLHMLIGAWLLGLNSLQANHNFNISILTEYSKYVINNKPFQIYG